MVMNFHLHDTAQAWELKHGILHHT